MNPHCSWCGRTPDTRDGQPPITWSMQTIERGVEWMCEECTRANLRSMEGRLPSEWW